MELLHNSGPVTTSGSISTATCGIVMNAKAYRVLSDNIYQNKIGSIVREISCNALDAHTENGNPERPFDIHVPDVFEPWFTVRDYGVGMSHESVNTVFIQYFESTKDQSNDSIGAFGLGAKTPFAYTDQFNVTSFHNGVMRAYSMFMNSNGVPESALMVEVPTDEPNGVEVKLGVKDGDVKYFLAEIKDQLKYFPIKPNLTNYTGPDMFPVVNNKEIYRSDDIVIYDFYRYGGGGNNIVQGPVAYPIQHVQVMSGLSPKNTDFLSGLTAFSYDMFFKIGEIGVTASREGVEYHAHTMKNINAKLDKIRADISVWIESTMANLSTDYEKAMFWNDNTTFQKFMLNGTIDMGCAVRMGTQYAFRLFNAPVFIDANPPVTTNCFLRTHNKSHRTSNLLSSVRDSDIIIPSSSSKIHIFIRDSNSAPIARMAKFFDDNNLDTAYTVNLVAGVEWNQDMHDALVEELGGFDQITRISDLPTIVRSRNVFSDGDRRKVDAFMWENGDNSHDVSYWKKLYTKKLLDSSADSVLDGETVAYVICERNRVLWENNASRYISLAGQGHIDMPLVAVRESDLERLVMNNAKSNINWVKAEDVVNKTVDDLANKYNVKRYMLISHIDRLLNDNRTLNLDEFDEIADSIDSDTRLGRMMRLKNKITAKLENSKMNFRMVQILGGDWQHPIDHPITGIIEREVADMWNSLPLIKSILSNYGSKAGVIDTPHAISYINHYGKITRKTS